MRKVLSLGFPVVLALLLAAPAFAQAYGPKTGDIWICPSVSPNNPKGMWVIGGHGAYYIIKPGTASHVWKGDPTDPMDDILNPTYNLGMHAPHVEDQAQVNAGWGLYHKLESYPNFVGMAMPLDDGSHYINDTYGIWIEPMMPIMVMPPTDGPQYDDVNRILYANIPLAAAVFW